MDVITESQVRNLIQAGTPPCVSIFLPTHPEGRDVRQDPVRLKNLLREAEAALVSHGMRGTEARDLLEPGRQLVDDGDFWTGPQSSVAIYLGKGFKRILRLPIEVDEAAVVNDQFELKPLLPLIQGKLFYVLSVSKGHTRLVECTPNSCRQIALPEDVAKSMKEAIQGEDEKPPHLQRHSGTANNPFSGAGAYHGQVADVQHAVEDDRDFYLRQIDDGVRRVVKDEEAPLIIAGVASVAPYYIKLSKHKNVLGEWIEGNADHLPNETLQKRGLEMLDPIWKKELGQLQDRFGTAISHQLGSDSIEDIVPSSVQGRVDTLFVSPKNTKWGRLHGDDLRVEVHNEKGDGDIDLIDRAATQTLKNGGRVVICKPEEVPGNKEIAAIYRY